MVLVEVYGGWRTHAEAAVRVVDSEGYPVSGAGVDIHWEGEVTGQDEQAPQLDGVIVFPSASVRFPVSGTLFVCVVDGVEKDGWAFDELNSVRVGMIAVE